MAIPGFVPLTSIPLSCERSDGPPEWALIELQGELERRDAAQPGQEFVFGQITRLLPLRYQKRPQASAPGGKQKAGVLELRIGYHLLEGGVEKLKKPLAVLEKRAIPRDEDMDDGAGPSACSGSAAPGEWLYDAEGLPRVIGVVRQKVLFKNRPRALISKPDPNKR